MMNNILTPQANQFLNDSINEILTDYRVSNDVALKISSLIIAKFNNKIIDFFASTLHVNELAIMKEALEQCKGLNN